MSETLTKRVENLEAEIRCNHRDIIALRKLVIELSAMALADDGFSHLSEGYLRDAAQLYRDTKPEPTK